MTTEVKQLEWLSTQYNGSTEGLSFEHMTRAGELVDALNVQDTFKALAERGPLYVGDLPSKNERTLLVAAGLATPCVVNGEDGHYTLTYFGLAVYKHHLNKIETNEPPTSPLNYQSQCVPCPVSRKPSNG